MKMDELKELADFMAENGISVLEIEEEGGEEPKKKIRIEKATGSVQMASQAVQTEKKATVQDKEVSGKAVKSPMVGVFYAAASPEENPYVQVGDKVKKGDVLCIIEAMKLMNEITADEDGEIAKICVSDGQVVEYGQCLFLIK